MTLTPFDLDPVTLRAVAADLDDRADTIRRCCDGRHYNHQERLATYTELANEYRTWAIRVELEAREARS